MPVIRSPPQRRPQQSLKQDGPQVLADRSNISNDSDQENQSDATRYNKKPAQQSVSQAIAAAKRQTTMATTNNKRSPSITVVADSTTRIWELEGEVSKLERDKRFLEDERRKFIEEREEERIEMKKEFASQLDTEKRRAQKELEACNSQWRAELDETNARHEKKERELERKLVQTKETLKADLEADFHARIEILEREKAKLKHEIELFELEMKEKQSLQSRVEYLEGELRSSRESSSKSLIQAKEDLEHIRTELKLQHQTEMTNALESLRSKLKIEHSELLQQNLDSVRVELELEYSNKLSATLETCRAEMRSVHEQQLIAIQSRHEEELKRMIAKESLEKQQLIEKLSSMEADNESLRASLWREQEARAREERQRLVDAELAQQRNDEAVARALSIVKRAEERIAQAVSENHHQGKMTTRVDDIPLVGAMKTTKSVIGRLDEDDDDDDEQEDDFAHQPPPPPPPSLHHPSSATTRTTMATTTTTRPSSIRNNGRMRRNSLPAITSSFTPNDESTLTRVTMMRRPSSPRTESMHASIQQLQPPSARAMRQSLLQQQQQHTTTSTTTVSATRRNNNMPNYLAQTQSSLAKLEQNEYLLMPNSSPLRNNNSRRASSPSIMSRRW